MTGTIFDDMDGKFDARLRRVFPTTRSTKSGDREIVVTNFVATVEAKFDFATLDRLYSPSFIAMERPTKGGTAYLIFEVVGVNPIHFQMLGMDVSMPTILRREYLDTISESWGRSQETWIDMGAVPTWYCMEVSEGEPEFEKSRLLPLAGAKVHLLSKKTVERFLCSERGEPLGTMIGFGVPLTVNLDNLIRFHAGIFGFTGSGKSNLTSVLLRKVMKAYGDTTVLVFDVSGEYTTHLIDIVESGGRVLSYEQMDAEEQLFNSQVIPESLEGSVSAKVLQRILGGMVAKGQVGRLSFGTGVSSLDLGAIEALLSNTADDAKSGAVAARIGLERLAPLMRRHNLQRSTKLSELDEPVKDELLRFIEDIGRRVNERTSLKSELDVISDYIQTPPNGGSGGEREREELTPEHLAEQILRGEAPRLNILYLPDPIEARSIVSRVIRRLLYLRKKHGSKGRVLVVLDEAQEYIPDSPRERDETLASNLAVEQLLRQGRKYRVHCWLATQRVAHLNVSALQQLHSYFVSTLPRFYDRMVIADSFALPYDVLERTAQLDTGQWIFVSYKATKQKSVPVFLETENNEERVADYLRSR